ncbi:MAG: hypothetical protein ACO1OK_06070 [Devosia sp.]
MKSVSISVFVVLAASALVSAPGAVGAEFKVHNNLNSPITSVRVTGGEVTGFKKIRPGNSQIMNVTMSGGQCQAFVRVRTESGNAYDGMANVCDKSGIVVHRVANGVRFSPGSQVLLR